VFREILCRRPYFFTIPHFSPHKPAGPDVRLVFSTLMEGAFLKSLFLLKKIRVFLVNESGSGLIIYPAPELAFLTSIKKNKIFSFL